MRTYIIILILFNSILMNAQLCGVSQSSDYANLLGDDLRNVILKVEKVNSDLFVLSQNGETNEESPILTKYNSNGNIVWKVTWEQSTYLQTFLIDKDRIFLTGFTRPFDNGNSSILIELRDLGNNYNLVSSNTFDLSTQREATRGMIKIKSDETPYAMMLHKGWISIDDAQIALLDNAGTIVEIKNYDLGDDQLWNGPVNDLDNTISIFGCEANEENEGFLLNTSSDLKTYEALSFFGLGALRKMAVDENQRQRLILSDKALTLVNENYDVLHSISLTEVIRNVQIEGPFIIAGKTTYYVLSQINISGVNKNIVTRLEIATSNTINSLWSRVIQVDGAALNGIFCVQQNGLDIRFLFGQSIENPTNGFGDLDIYLAEIDESSCQLLDHNLTTTTNSIEVVRQEMVVTDQVIPDMIKLDISNSKDYSCLELDTCDPCDNDTEEPICIPQDITIELGSLGTATITPDMVNNGSFDACGEVSINLDINSFTCDNLGQNDVTLIVEDNAGNKSTCTAIVTVINNMPPTLFCIAPINSVQLNEDGIVFMTPANFNYTVEQNCLSRLESVVTPNSFTCDNIGTNAITLTVTDENGNSASCQTTVMVLDSANNCYDCEEDNNPPIISCNAQIVTYVLGENGTAEINLDLHQFTAMDDCDIDQIQPSLSELNCDHVSTIPNYISVTVTDIAGNSSECQIGFIVLDPNDFCIPEGCDIECYSGVINLSTGINNQEVELPIGQYVGNWVLIDGPDQNVTYPRPGFVLNPNAVWDQLPGSQYISPYPNANNNDSHVEPYLFERCFCVCEETAEVGLNISVHVDNFFNIGLYDDNGNLIQDLMGYSGPSSTIAFRDPAFSSITNHTLSRGTYCLRAGLRNDGSVTMGMQINAAVTNAGFINSSCCNPYTYILGTVFQDVNCDSLNNFNGDTGLEGIEVSLSQNGTIIETILTDQFGYYVFNDIEPGDYNVIVENVSDNTQTMGSEGYEISIGIDTIIGNLDFGFCEIIETCCASTEQLTHSVLTELNSEAIVCGTDANVKIETPNLFDCQYISTIYWGDGEVDTLSPEDEIPQHTYNGNGAYLISIEVSSVLENGEVCQTDEVNHVIIIKDCVVSTDFPDAERASIKLYPVPFSAVLKIDFSQNKSGYQLEVYNITGQMLDLVDIPNNLFSYNYENANLPTGTFLFKIVSMDGTIILQSKVIKI